MFKSTHPITREEWEKNPKQSLIKAFKDEMKDYKGGDVTIQIPRTQSEIMNGARCKLTLEVELIAMDFCGSEGINFNDKGVIIFRENPWGDHSENAVKKFANAIKCYEQANEFDRDHPVTVNGITFPRLKIR